MLGLNRRLRVYNSQATMRRRSFLGWLSASLIAASHRLPANRNVKWAVSANLWNHFNPVAFTDILDVMRDTGFIGIRITQFPGILQKYQITTNQLEAELSKRNLQIATISFGGPTHDPAQQTKVLDDARKAMDFLASFGANRLGVFSVAATARGAERYSIPNDVPDVQSNRRAGRGERISGGFAQPPRADVRETRGD